jgi:hypothetical protein
MDIKRKIKKIKFSPVNITAIKNNNKIRYQMIEIYQDNKVK